MRKALLKVGYSCNNNCVFCHSARLRGRLPNLGLDELKTRIRLAKLRGAQMVVFSGGEPTLRPDIGELARFCAAHGLRSGLATNGRRLVYKAFVDELVRQGLSFVYLSFHSASRAGHSRSAGTDSFHQILAALSHLAGAGVETTVNTVVTRLNIGELPAIVDLLAARGAAKLKFSAVEPKGAALENPELCPPLAQTAAAISSVLRYGRAKYPGTRFGCEGLTPCLLEDYHALNDDLAANDFFLFQEAFEDRLFAPDNANRGKLPACVDCAQEERCPGVFAGYLSGLEAGVLRPDSRPRSNSFVFVAAGDAVAVPSGPDGCPGRDATSREIFVAKTSTMVPYRTPTRDFSESEIRELRALGQIYAAAGRKHRRLDFGDDLVKLRPAPVCLSCEERGSCSRIYAPSRVPVHAPLEAAVERRVRGLRGDVLDVGCGSVRFRPLVAAAARAGLIRYVGIDPALPPVKQGRGMRFERTSVEDFAAEDSSFDWIVLLRSYNHISRPSAAFPKLRRWLRPQGRLLVVDGTAFGLVVSKTPKPAAPGDFEHLRNHDSRRAKSLIEGFGFSAIREIPVTVEGCNEWLLELERS